MHAALRQRGDLRAAAGPDAGHWSVRPAGAFDAERRYLPGSLAIETTFTTDTGTVRLIDAMAAAEGQRGHDLGFDAPHEVLRAVEGVEGDVKMVMELAPRPEYGLIRPLIRLEDGGARTFGSGRVSVRSSVPLEVEDATMRAAFRVRAGDAHGFSLRWASAEDRTPQRATPADRIRARIDDTVSAWRSWEAEHDVYQGPHRELVRHSARILKGSRTARPARSSPRRPRRCPRPSAASATGTTASPGSATRASRSRRSTSAPARTRRRSSSRS